MAYAPTQLGQDPQFEPFLYAPLGEDRRGSSVTVLSMLARLGVDPWSEASELSRLPVMAAQQRLEALMTRFHDVPTPVSDQSRIVSGLLALLPSRATTGSSPRDGTLAKLALRPQRSPFYWIIAAALFVGWIAMLAQGK
ncbi:hypothetical protein [Yoonia sp.]|uniref:hypothetical protein n=1 Tax=Yoonia sp. TaxID=2212373 RepID=UPI0019EA2994|nr:hypothetical protein [Yoonia sp.]MBE0414670.1 hypothetical protein [Yoonia sp.]